MRVYVVEHLAVPGPTFRDLCAHLSTNALLLVSTPNVLRFETYWSFVFRWTGHPTPLERYLEAENSYVHHQREFTMDELKRLLVHFGCAIHKSSFNDLRPLPVELRAYQGITEGGTPNRCIKARVFAMTRGLLPPSVIADNLLVLAQRVR
jgi:hypothetical protein